MGQDHTSADTTEWEQLLELLSCRIERQAHKGGWDQPASLWTIEGSDYRGRDEDNRPWAIPVGFAARKRLEFEGSPTGALIGLRIDDAEVLGVALVSEGWGYSDAKLEALAETADLNLDKPSAYDDSVEVRLVHLIFRDGTESAVMRRRGQDKAVTGARSGEVGGRLAWAVRRTLGLPSGAANPPFESVRVRAMAHTALSMLDSVRTLEPGGSTVDQAAEWLTRQGSQSLTDMLLGLSGMQGNTWEEAYARAQDSYTELYETVGGESVRSTLEFLRWCDSSMWATHIDESTPELDELRSQLVFYSSQGVLSAENLAAFKKAYHL